MTTPAPGFVERALEHTGIVRPSALRSLAADIASTAADLPACSGYWLLDALADYATIRRAVRQGVYVSVRSLNDAVNPPATPLLDAAE